MKKGFIAYLKTCWYSGLYLIINMLAIIGSTVYLCFYDDNFYNIMYDIFINNGDYGQLYNLIAYLVAPSTTITGVVIILIYIIKSLVQKKCTAKKISLEMVFLMISIGYVANMITTAIVEALPSSLTTASYTESISLALSNENVLFLLISTGIAAPILEEILFRDWIYNCWSHISIPVAMIVSSLLFGMAHMNLIQSTYAFLLGLMFAYINRKFDSILPGIIMHLTVNSSSVILDSYKTCEKLWYIPFIISICFIIYEIVKYKKFSIRKVQDFIKGEKYEQI